MFQFSIPKAFYLAKKKKQTNNRLTCIFETRNFVQETLRILRHRVTKRCHWRLEVTKNRRQSLVLLTEMQITRNNFLLVTLRAFSKAAGTTASFSLRERPPLRPRRPFFPAVSGSVISMTIIEIFLSLFLSLFLCICGAVCVRVCVSASYSRKQTLCVHFWNEAFRSEWAREQRRE